MAEKEVNPPNQFLTDALFHSQEGQRLALSLNEKSVTLKQIEQIQKEFSLAACEATKLKTWMLENLPPIKEEDAH